MCRPAYHALVDDTAIAVVLLIQTLMNVIVAIIALVERQHLKMEWNVREVITVHKALLTIYYALRDTTVDKLNFQMSAVLVKKDTIALMDL